MRKFLRLLMLVLMVAYCAQSYGEVMTFKAKDNTGKRTKKRLVGPNEYQGFDCKNGAYPSPTSGSNNVVKFTVPDQDYLYIDYSYDNLAYYWKIYKNNRFIIETTRPIRHISISFSSAGNHGGDIVRVTEGGSWRSFDNNAGHDGDGCVTPANASTTKVIFTGSGEVDILWIKVFFDDPQPSNVSLSFTGSTTFTDKTNVSLSQSGYSTVYWSDDGSDPKDKKNEGTFSNKVIDYSHTYKAIGVIRKKASSDGEVDGNDNVEYDTFGTTVATLHCQKYYDLTIGSGGYSTFCYDGYSWTVPSGMTAYAYTTSATKRAQAPCYLKATTTYVAGSTIPAGTPVVVKATVRDDPYRFINPDLNPKGTPPSNALSGNGSDKKLSKSSYNNTSNTYYYLMQEYQNGPWGFFWCAPKGAAVDLGPHKAYLVLSGAQAAKGFVMQMPDDDSTTGIVAIPVYGDPATPRGLDPSAPMYNAAGQRVGASYKGIVIQDGRKFVKR